MTHTNDRLDGSPRVQENGILDLYNRLSIEAKEHDLVKEQFYPFQLAIDGAPDLATLDQAKFSYDDPATAEFIDEGLATVEPSSLRDELREYIAAVRRLFDQRATLLGAVQTTNLKVIKTTMTLATCESLSDDAKKHPLVETQFHPFELAIGTAIELSALEQAKYKYDDPAEETFVTDQLAGIKDKSMQEEITDYISTVRFFYTLRRSVLKDQYTTKTPTTMQKAINGFMKQMAHESAT